MFIFEYKHCLEYSFNSQKQTLENVNYCLRYLGITKI